MQNYLIYKIQRIQELKVNNICKLSSSFLKNKLKTKTKTTNPKNSPIDSALAEKPLHVFPAILSMVLIPLLFDQKLRNYKS